MEQFITKLETYADRGPWIEGLINRVTRHTNMYVSNDLPRAAWRHLMVQCISMQSSDLAHDEEVCRPDVNITISDMLKWDENING
jgi:hypothetical protein